MAEGSREKEQEWPQEGKSADYSSEGRDDVIRMRAAKLKEETREKINME